MDFMTRLRELRKASYLTQEQLAQRIGVTKQAISQYERGIRQPEYEMLETLGDFFNVDLDYLIGRSDKTTLFPQSGYYINPATSPQRALSSDESSLLADYQKLNAAGRQKVREYASDLTEQKKYTEDTGSSTSAAG